jgi:gas vesicle protein
MEYENESAVLNFLAGVAVGAAIGAAVAVLTAPQSGRRTRRRIRKAAGDFRSQAGDRIEDLKEEVKGKVDEAFRGARGRLSI